MGTLDYVLRVIQTYDKLCDLDDRGQLFSYVVRERREFLDSIDPCKETYIDPDLLVKSRFVKDNFPELSEFARKVKERGIYESKF